MLLTCSECNLPVSDKALACPHCGCPLQPDVKRKPRKSKRRKRLPNGFGQISEIKGRNLRNPYRAMVCVGKTEEGRPICKPLKPKAYFATYNEAYAALVEYNKNPYDLDKTITVQELYERWSAWYYPKFRSDRSEKTFSTAWGYCSDVYDMPVTELRVRHIKHCMENGTKEYRGEIRTTTPSLQKKIKTVFNLMLDYAVEFEIIEKNYARSFGTSFINKNTQASNDEPAHISFTKEEMEILWDNLYKVPYVDHLLIQCYSGWRPQELGLIELKNVDLEAGFFRGGMKTDAGTNRIVPIHSRIKPLVERKYKEAEQMGSIYLLNVEEPNVKDRYLSYRKYYSRFKKTLQMLNINPEHKPHDCRKHFVTMAKKYYVDEYAIKYMVGHVIHDLTEQIYTDRDSQWLKQEIEKIR